MRPHPRFLVLLIAPALLAAARPARAHSTGESFLVLRGPAAPDGGSGSWDLAVRDLDDALAIDADGDGQVTAGELRGRRAEIEVYALEHLTLTTTAGPCAPQATSFSLSRRSGAAYAALGLQLRCPPLPVSVASRAPALTVDDRLFFDRDGLHRAFVTLEDDAREETETALLRAGQTSKTFALADSHPGGARTTALGFVAEGALHIWQGFDHVLFLVVLLLPAVLRRRDDPRDQTTVTWAPAPSLRAALGDVLRVITAFTVAHSITLGLAAVGALRASGRIIEPAIAASVVLAAANNLRPVFGRDRWVVAFALGLLHGFGFSAVLAEVGLPKGHLLAALFGFNFGVELGQLALVALFVPLAYCARRTNGYQRFGLAGGSAVAGTVALVWFIERALGVSFFG